MAHTLTHSHTLDKTRQDEGSARRRDLYVATRNTDKKQTTMHAAGFEPATTARERPRTEALKRVATGISSIAFNGSH